MNNLLIVVPAMVIAVLAAVMVLDAVLSKFAKQRNVFLDLVSRDFWGGMGVAMTSKVEEWAAEHDAAEAAKKAKK